MNLNLVLEFLQAVSESPEALLAAINSDYQYIFFNRVYQEEIKRLSGKDIQIGMNVKNVYDLQPELQKVAIGEWERSLQGEKYERTLKFGIQDGYHKVYKSLHIPLRDDKGKIVGSGLVSKDITENFIAEKAKLESDNRFQLLFTGMTEGFAVCELIVDEKTDQAVDFRFLDVNPACERIIGIPRTELINRTCLELFASEVALNNERLNIFYKTSLPMHLDIQFSNSERYFDIFASPTEGRKFYVFFTDVSEQKAAEKNQEWLASFPENNTQPVLEINLQGQITYENPTSKKLFPGIDSSVSQHPMLKEIEKVITEFGQGNIEHITREIHCKDLWFRQSVLYLPEMKRIRIYSTDITDRILAEKALLEANARLEETVELRTEQIRNAYEALQQDIEQRDQMEKALFEEKTRLNKVLEILPSYIIFLTPDYHISFANQYFRERFGEFHGRRCHDYLFNRNDPCENCESYSVMKTHQPHRWEWEGPDSHIYDVYDYPLQDSDGKPFILEMGIDITEMRQAQKTISISDAYNRSLIEANLDTLVTITSEGKIGDVNAATERITGLTRKELIGTDFHSYFTDPDRARAGYQKVFDTGSVRDYELELRHKDGHTTPVAYNASVYYDPDGKVAGVFAGARDLSELKRSAEELLLLNTALKAAANGILITDQHGNILWSNPAVSHMTGYREDEITNKNPRILKSGIQDEAFYNLLWQTILSGKAWHGEIINRRKDGSLYVEEQTITPVFDKDGEISNFVVIKEDISERKASEIALRESELRYRTLVETSQDSVLMLDLNRKVILANQRAASELGFRYTGEMTGLDIESVVSSEDKHILQDGYSLSLERGMLKDIECRLVRQDGTEFPGQLAISILRDTQGNANGFLMEITNISSRKQAENVVRQNAKRNQLIAETSLAMDEAALDEHAIIERVTVKCSLALGGACILQLASPDMHWLDVTAIYDPDTHTQSLFTNTFQQGRQSVDVGLASEVYHKGVPIIFSEENYHDYLDRAFPLIKPIIENYGYKNMIIVPIRITGKPIGTIAVLHPAGGYPYSEDDLGLLQLMADRLGLALQNARLYHDLEKSLKSEQEMHKQMVLSEKLAAMGRLLGSITHELNNPLQTIKNCLYLIQGDLEPKSPVVEFLDIASSETERISNLVGQLREMYRPQQNVKFLPVCLNEILDEVRNLMKTQMQEMNMEWVGEPIKNCPIEVTVNGISDQLKQVFINICTNAMEAMQPVGGKLFVEIRPPNNQKEVSVRIKDTGPGISEENILKMFEPFFSTKAKGLGLGLAICYDIIHRHGGRISVESKPGEGATFDVWLPLLEG